MSTFWKILVTLYNLFLVLVAAVVIALALGLPQPMQWIDQAFSTTENRLISGIVGAFFLLVGLRTMIQVVKTDRANAAVVQESPDGTVLITVPAIKQIVLKAVRMVEGVREVKPNVRCGRDGVMVELTLLVNPDYKLPEMTAAVQAKVREYLEQIGGLRVSEIRVAVDDFASKPGVR